LKTFRGVILALLLLGAALSSAQSESNSISTAGLLDRIRAFEMTCSANPGPRFAEHVSYFITVTFTV
jgi:hypothetical protein